MVADEECLRLGEKHDLNPSTLAVITNHYPQLGIPYSSARTTPHRHHYTTTTTTATAHGTLGVEPLRLHEVPSSEFFVVLGMNLWGRSLGESSRSEPTLGYTTKAIYLPLLGVHAWLRRAHTIRHHIARRLVTSPSLSAICLPSSDYLEYRYISRPMGQPLLMSARETRQTTSGFYEA